MQCHCNDCEYDCRSDGAKYADGEGLDDFPVTRWQRMAARPLRTFTVLPNLPAELQGLQQLAYNLWWCWNHDAIALFRRIDENKFEKAEHSPVQLLATVGQERFDQLKDDDGFMAHLG